MLACRWFERFRDEAADESAWAALQVVAHLADKRFEYRSTAANDASTRDMGRTRMIEMNRLGIKRSLRKERDHDNRLFGLKIKKDQIWPFVRGDAVR